MNLQASRPTFRPLWKLPLPNVPRGLSLSRERACVLVWDDKQWLYLLNRRGERETQVHLAGDIVAAVCSDHGGTFAAVGQRGEIWWLAPDLMPRWEKQLMHPATALATDPFGQYLAVSDMRGNLTIYDRMGKTLATVHSPRPLHHLTFVPCSPFLVGASDYGLVVCFDLTGRIIWRDGLVAHIGSLATSGEGDRIVLACFTEGLHQYNVKGEKGIRISLPEPSKSASLSFDGSRTLVNLMANRLLLLDAVGQILAVHPLDTAATAIAMGALGNRCLVTTADKHVHCLTMD